MKLKIPALALLVIFLLSSCKPNTAPLESLAPSASSETPVMTTETPVQTITQEEALQLLVDKFGERDSDTGFLFSWGFVDMIEQDGVEYYNFRLSWLVEDENGNPDHLSYLSNFLVSKDGSEILDYLPPIGGLNDINFESASFSYRLTYDSTLFYFPDNHEGTGMDTFIGNITEEDRLNVSVDILMKTGYSAGEMAQQSATALADNGYAVEAVKTVTIGSDASYQAEMLFAENKDTGDVRELYYVNSGSDCYEISLSYTTETKADYQEAMQLMLDTFRIIK